MAPDPLAISPEPGSAPRDHVAGSVTAPLRDVAAALAFLTRLPVPSRWLVEERSGAAAFGVAGAAIGAAAAVPLVLVGQAHPGPAAIASIAVVAILSGGLHLDGLADTADALAAPAGAADRARLDPRAGTAGVVAVVLILLLDAALIGELASAGGWDAAAAVIAAGAASRSAATVAGVLAGPTRGGGRLGSWFVSRLRPLDAWLAIATAAVAAGLAAAVTGASVAVGTILGSAVAVAAGALIVRLRRRLDGDGFGALVELTFAAVLAGIVAARSVGG